MKLSLAYSTCPNDTFIFGALAKGLIKSENIDRNHFLADVEVLNKEAFEARFDITKLSFSAYLKVRKNYDILSVGAALGFSNGPLIISNNYFTLENLSEKQLAIPGLNTTANLLVEILLQKFNRKKEYLFSDIENAILNREVDAGLIIHETRFTYQEKGLVKICDLGELWEQQTHLPLPLGCIAIRKSLPDVVKKQVLSDIYSSLQFSKNNTDEVFDYILQYAQEMSKEVALKHIQTYVNEYTYNLGTLGKQAINELINKCIFLGIVKPFNVNIIEL